MHLKISTHLAEVSQGLFASQGLSSLEPPPSPFGERPLTAPLGHLMMVILSRRPNKNIVTYAFAYEFALFLLGAMIATIIQYDKRREETFFNRRALYLLTREATHRLFFVFIVVPRPECQQKCPVRLKGANETLIIHIILLFMDNNIILISNGSCFSQESFRT